MFAATTLLYPCALAALCAGAGLAIDRLSGRFLPLCLIVSVGLATLIGLSQLSTYIPGIAPATPYLMLALALGGLAVGRARASEALRALLARPWPALASVLAYVLALAPVLLSGRTSFSSYQALADSAVHMMGADYLIVHGQHFAHLDLRNSYGQFLRDYYGSGYPSGADTLFGGSAVLLGLPLIWAFQPFNAFVLASGVGPAWSLLRRVGLRSGWAALAALTIVTPALVYAYELLASVKELTALAMLLALGALVVAHRQWLGRPAGAIPFALAIAAGASALGVAFAAWALPPTIVLAFVLMRAGGKDRDPTASPAGHSSRRSLPARHRELASIFAAAVALALAALPTWAHVSAALRVARVIATTGNAGNLHTPLRFIQLMGVWLRGSYKLAPAGAALTATHALIALAFVAAVLGAVHVLRVRAYALAGWVALTLLASLLVSRSVTTWADAKTLVLSSPLALLLAWAGVSALASARPRQLARAAAALIALALAGGVLASDALLYRGSNLAPTARYEELASLDRRFAGRGPTLFTDFDEYSMYELRDLDVGGPDFVYPPAALASLAGGYGDPVELERAAPAALRSYRLILTRRDPLAPRPPAVYRLAWQGAYYQMWERAPRAPAALAHVTLTGASSARCARVGGLAARARGGEQLAAAPVSQLVRIALRRSPHPARWGREREGLVMGTPGTLSAHFALPRGGMWSMWVQGQIMPTVTLAVDGRKLASISGQLDGNSLVPDTVPPIAVRLAAGLHTLTIARTGFSLAPGNDGTAVLDRVLLTPASDAPAGALRVVAPGRWRSLCAGSYEWVELLRSIGART